MPIDRAEALKTEIRFLRGALARPLAVGAIAPSSKYLARAIAAEIDPHRAGAVLELGPGTGAVTEALVERGIQPSRIVAIERDEDFARDLRARFPDAEIICGDAFDLSSVSVNGHGHFAGIVSGLPLLNHPPPRRQAFVESALARLAPGAPLVQFSYGFTAPIAPPSGAEVEMAAFVWRNLPPARVWVYRRS